MLTNEVLRTLTSYSNDELFYMELFKSRSDPKKLGKFLQMVDKKDAESRGLIIPELFDYRPNRFGDNWFDTKVHKKVYLMKHNRYTPPYEHDHEFFEIIYVLSGTCDNVIFGKKDTMAQGDLCLISPSVKHSIWTTDGLVVNILIRRSTMAEVFSSLLHGGSIISDFFTSSLYLRDFASCLMFRTSGDEYISNQILEMFGEQLDSDEYSENIISNMLMIFFHRLVRGYKDTAEYPDAVKEKSESVSKILDMIAADCAGITLPAIADSLGYSTVYCSKYIRKTTGSTFSNLLKKVRLEKAVGLLTTTMMSIAEISAICGYDNPENFNRVFRRELGMPPSQYRESFHT